MSIVTVSAEEAADRFPAASETRAVIECTPSANTLAVTVVVVLLPTSTPPAYSVHADRAGRAAAGERRRGVVGDVVEFDRPLSLAEDRFGATGEAGAAVSMVTVVAAEMPTLPATSAVRGADKHPCGRLSA